MKYVAIIDSDDELSEETIKEIKNTLFLGGEKASYCFELTSIKEAPEPKKHLIGITEEGFWFRAGYDRGLKDCGVIEDDKIR